MNVKKRILPKVCFIMMLVSVSCSQDSGQSTTVLSTIQIGTQVWTDKNLDLDHYRNGDLIPEVTDPTEWANVTTGAWCYYNNDPANGPIFGKIYNWFALNDPRGLAPAGFHIPSDAEWNTLTSYLGGDAVAGGKMKETGLLHWNSNVGATNSSGFTALPAGHRISSGIFEGLGSFTIWSSKSEYNINYVWNRYVEEWSAVVERQNNLKWNGYSVRCVKN